MIHRSYLLALALSFALPLLAAAAPEPVVFTSLLHTVNSWEGAPLAGVPARDPELHARILELAPGAATPWHEHPLATYAYVLQGTLRVELADGKSRDFPAGEAFAEAVSVRHRGRNVGAVPVRVVAFYLGERGTPISVPAPAPSNAKK